MKIKKRGSEKLMNSCTGLSTLSQDELDQIGGGAWGGAINQFGSYKTWKVFPFGIIDPQVLQMDKIVNNKGLVDLERGISNGF